MRTYEMPLGVTFRASTPEHAAARVFGGKPGDYLAGPIQSSDWTPGTDWVSVTRPGDPEFFVDIPVQSL